MQDDGGVPVPQNSLCAENDNNVFPVQVLSHVWGLLHRRGLMQRLPGLKSVFLFLPMISYKNRSIQL